MKLDTLKIDRLVHGFFYCGFIFMSGIFFQAHKWDLSLLVFLFGTIVREPYFSRLTQEIKRNIKKENNKMGEEIEKYTCEICGISYSTNIKDNVKAYEISHEAGFSHRKNLNLRNG